VTGRIFDIASALKRHPVRLIHNFAYHIIMKGI